jgi:hypothetical protein
MLEEFSLPQGCMQAVIALDQNNFNRRNVGAL